MICRDWCVRYYYGADSPDLGLWWTDSVGELIDFALGWTFVVEIGKRWQPAILTKTTGINGTAGSGDPDDPTGLPNLAVVWTAGELDPVTPGEWVIEITATDTNDGNRERKTQGKLTMVAEVLAEVP